MQCSVVKDDTYKEKDKYRLVLNLVSKDNIKTACIIVNKSMRLWQLAMKVKKIFTVLGIYQSFMMFAAGRLLMSQYNLSEVFTTDNRELLLTVLETFG